MTLSAQLENQGQRKQARPLSVLTMDTLEIQRIAQNSTGDLFFRYPSRLQENSTGDLFFHYTSRLQGLIS